MALIQLEGIVVAYGDTVPFADLNTSFGARLTVVTGPSGSGKSSLLRVMAGLQAPTSGAVRIHGEPVRRPTWSHAGDERVVLIHQDYQLVDFLSVEENLLLGAELRGVAADRDRAGEVLAQVELDDSYLPRRPGTLSGGERQRVAIARALMCDAKLLLADEPTGALDAANTENVAAVLRTVSEATDVQVVVATHDPLVAQAAEERYTVANGTLVPA